MPRKKRKLSPENYINNIWSQIEEVNSSLNYIKIYYKHLSTATTTNINTTTSVQKNRQQPLSKQNICITNAKKNI